MKGSRKNLGEVAGLFFKLGWIAFGGPAAHIAMLEDEVVTKRKWMDRQHFLDLMGATNLIPGPNSTEMVMHCGYQRAGILGLFVGGLCFLFPAVVLTGLLAWVYINYGEVPALKPFFYGIKPAVLVLIAGAVYKLGKKALKGWELIVVGLAAAAASAFGINEAIAILGAGAMFMIYRSAQRKENLNTFFPAILLLIPAMSKAGSLKIFLTFLKIGCILFGSGYVLIAYLDGELVNELGWMTRQELLDAVAIGQFTPGPVLSTATFVGYQVSGSWWGALAATAGIFLPSFLFVLLLHPLVPKMRKSKPLGAFLDGVNSGAVGIMAAVAALLAWDTVTDWRTLVITGVVAILFFSWKKFGALSVVGSGAALGYLFSLIP